MPDEYDAMRKNLTSYERGLYFELGRAHEMVETRDKGWVKQFRIQTAKGPRVLDNARSVGRAVEGVERKSGKVNERDAREQLNKERAGLESGQIFRSRWETVAGEKVPDKIRQQMRELAHDSKGKFQHIEISREAATRAVEIGRSLASQQLELIRPYELQRADRARERLAKIRQIVRAQERAEKFRKMQQFREAAIRGRADAPQKIERDRQAREEAERARQARGADERARVERTPAERVALEFPVPGQFQEREAPDTGEQAAREAGDAASVERAAEKEREAAEKEREAAFKALDEARNAAFKELDEKGRLSEVERLLWLGQATHPQAAVREPPGHAPGVVRGGTGQGHERSRGVSRDR
ncbi:hypothetical protein [Nocardia amamiensis]|uniref:hypothetical protein n=1 Tax=Nocardia amamiensis TaxID=404578 RepID=UPI0008337672|nr:hypothetical protein [Nocardia amamiensis]